MRKKGDSIREVPGILKVGIIRVICPYCGHSHYHIYANGTGLTRKAHCQGGEYRIVLEE